MDDAPVTEKEASFIARRRSAWGERNPGPDAPITGLALSGGGIRSATFSLGLLQALAEHKRLPNVDYLSTVSGGGYAGSFLGSLFLPRYSDLTVPYPTQGPGDTRARETPLQAAERVEKILSDAPDATATTVTVGNTTTPTFHPIRWLRENGRYLTPSGVSDYLFMAAYYLRALTGVQTVLGVVLFGVALAFYTVRLLLDAWVPLPQFWALSWAPALREGASLWMSPILWLAPVVLVVFSVPLVLTYWVVYQQFGRRRSTEDWAVALGPVLLGAASFALAIYSTEQVPANPIGWVLLYAGAVFAAAVLLRDVIFTLQLGMGWRKQASAVAQARQKLTRWLTTSLYVVLALVGIGLIDSLGQSMFIGVVRNELLVWGGGGAGVVAALMAVRRAADWLGSLSGASSQGARLKQFMARNYRLVALAVGLAALLALATLHATIVQMVCWSGQLPGWRALAPVGWDSVAPTRAGAALHDELLMWTWGVWGVIALLIGLSVGFLNNSTFHRFYASRLTRTYLGAANFVRLRQFWDRLQSTHAAASAVAATPEKKAGTTLLESHHDDDIALRSYYEPPSAGPLHLINVALNESVSKTSSLQREDRKGVALCVGPAGLGVNASFRPWHTGINQTGSAVSVPGVSSNPTTPNPALCAVERLPLGSWVAISGAAVSTGLGHMSATGISLLTWLANVRLAYWWKPAPLMRAVPIEQATRGTHAYDLMWQEMRGAFAGQCCPYWNLSDGGHFENTAAYELIRRRVPLIFVADNGADPGYGFSDLENLVRRVRIDFGAEITLLDPTALDQLVSEARAEHAPLRALLGTPADFQSPSPGSRRCALVARVTYPGTKAPSLLIIIKPTLNALAPLDVQTYGATHPDFPQQTTADQFFDEAQWESYRKLGLETGRALFAHWGAWVDAVRESHPLLTQTLEASQ